MLSQIKTAIRITHTKLDDDIQSNISTCLLDLGRAGVSKIDQTDNLIIKCCELYVKWQYNYENSADRYERAYKSLRDALTLCGDYNE